MSERVRKESNYAFALLVGRKMTIMAFSARRKRTRKQSSSSDARLDCYLVPGEASNSGRTGIFACPTFRQCLVQNKQVFRTDGKKFFTVSLAPRFCPYSYPSLCASEGPQKVEDKCNFRESKDPTHKDAVFRAYFSGDFAPEKNDVQKGYSRPRNKRGQ